ncbi:MAG: hypothetical protein GY794_10770 [bacterium]|nr:hypothetical protein [bacterium]
MPDEVLKYLRRASRRILVQRTIAAAGLGVIVGGLLAVAGQVALWMLGYPHRSVGIIMLAGGLLVGVLVAIIKGVSLHQTARYLDNRGDLDERLTTAFELNTAGDSSPAARCVYTQAEEAVRSGKILPINLWVCNRVVAGGAILVLLLCGTLAMLPQHRGTDEQILDALGQMSPEAVKALADEFARAARRAGDNAPLLTRAATATKRKDVRALTAILADLRRRGVLLRRIVRPEVISLATAGGSNASGAAKVQDPPPSHGDPVRTGGGMVHVWDPLYTKVNSTIAPDTQPAGDAVVSYTDAWSEARLRAAGSLRSGKIPAEYRRMVRDFFSDR